MAQKLGISWDVRDWYGGSAACVYTNFSTNMQYNNVILHITIYSFNMHANPHKQYMPLSKTVGAAHLSTDKDSVCRYNNNSHMTHTGSLMNV